MSIRNCNRKLEISTAPTKAKSRVSAYSQALVQNKSIGSGSDPESGRQAGSQAGRQAGRQTGSQTAMLDEMQYVSL